MKNRILLPLILLSALRVNSQVPVYNSFPSASAVIYLDFDGQTVSGTGWNSAAPIYCGGSGLNESQITEIFNRVAEDYRPFTVNITTDSAKYLSAPNDRRMRVIVTVTSDWYGSAGGVSFVNSFSWGDDTPCFVFSALLSYDTKNIAEAVSHEAGHTLGLRHQSTYDNNCVKVSEYNSGQGAGEQSWAPIMGVGYARNLTTWYNGQSTLGCNIYQNDLDVITSSANGISFRSDYQPNSFATAPLQNFTNKQFTASNIIVKNTYQDLYKFSMPSLKPFQLSAVPFNVGSGNAGADLDLKVTLFDSAQTILNSYTSSSTLNVIIDTILAAGTYYFKVEGVGNSYAPDYAILGSYSVKGQIIDNSSPLDKLELTGTCNNDQHILNWTVETGKKVLQQVLESSSDGKNFTSLAQLAVDTRSYSYRPAKPGSSLYRLHVMFDDNSDEHSNTVLIKEVANRLRPKLVNSLITNGTLLVTSPSLFEYALFDSNGKILRKGTLINGMNSVDASWLVNGIYFIRFSITGQEWTEKLVKQ